MVQLAKTHSDHANVRAGVEWLLANDIVRARRALSKAWMIYVFLRPGIDPAEIERWLERMLDGDTAPDTRAAILVALSQRRFARGDLNGSRGAAEEAVRVAEANGVNDVAPGGHHRVAIALAAAGETGAAVEHFGRAIDGYGEANPAGRAWAYAQRGGVLSASGDAAAADADFAAAREISARLPHHRRSFAVIRTLEGEHLLTQGRSEEARAAFADAVAVFREVGSEIPIARVLRGLAELAARRGDPEAALRTLGAAEEMRARQGDTWPARAESGDLADAARRLGGRADALRAEGQRMGVDAALALALADPRRTKPGLSDREREVAGLVAEGLTSAEIARRLVISERTAENHVEHILVKLGVRSRAQIARWAVEQGLVGAR